MHANKTKNSFCFFRQDGNNNEECRIENEEFLLVLNVELVYEF